MNVKNKKQMEFMKPYKVVNSSNLACIKENVSYTGKLEYKFLVFRSLLLNKKLFLILWLKLIILKTNN